MRVGLILGTMMLLSNSALADVWTFETPSENIQCSAGQEIGFADLICTIIERSGSPALPRPEKCAEDWGHTFFMNDRGRAEILCVTTNRNKDGYGRADYGRSVEFGGIFCQSSAQGLRCQNRDGHGFFLSRRRQEVF